MLAMCKARRNEEFKTTDGAARAVICLNGPTQSSFIRDAGVETHSVTGGLITPGGRNNHYEQD